MCCTSTTLFLLIGSYITPRLLEFSARPSSSYYLKKRMSKCCIQYDGCDQSQDRCTFKNTKLASRKFLLSLSPPCIYGLRLRRFSSPNVIAVPSHSPTPIFPTVSRENQFCRSIFFCFTLFLSVSCFNDNPCISFF